jgi:hypothetical protein
MHVTCLGSGWDGDRDEWERSHGVPAMSITAPISRPATFGGCGGIRDLQRLWAGWQSASRKAGLFIFGLTGTQLARRKHSPTKNMLRGHHAT